MSWGKWRPFCSASICSANSRLVDILRCLLLIRDQSNDRGTWFAYQRIEPGINDTHLADGIFKCIFLIRKQYLHFDSDFIEFFPGWSKWQDASIGNGLMINRLQAIIWNDFDEGLKCHIQSSCHNGLRRSITDFFNHAIIIYLIFWPTNQEMTPRAVIVNVGVRFVVINDINSTVCWISCRVFVG